MIVASVTRKLRFLPAIGEITSKALFETYDALKVRRRPGVNPALIFAEYSTSVDTLKSWVEEMNSVAMVVQECEVPMKWLSERATLLDYAIVDERFIGEQALPAFVANIRTAAPDLPVILLSRNVLYHNFQTNQVGVADVTLRAPVSRTALKLGILSAIDNRRWWRENECSAL